MCATVHMARCINVDEVKGLGAVQSFLLKKTRVLYWAFTWLIFKGKLRYSASPAECASVQIRSVAIPSIPV